MTLKAEHQAARVLATFPRGSYEEARVTLIREPGKEARVDFRVWWRPPDVEGEEWRPTKKGIRFLLSCLPRLIEALQAALRECGVEGAEAVGSPRPPSPHRAGDGRGGEEAPW